MKAKYNYKKKCGSSFKIKHDPVTRYCWGAERYEERQQKRHKEVSFTIELSDYYSRCLIELLLNAVAITIDEISINCIDESSGEVVIHPVRGMFGVGEIKIRDLVLPDYNFIPISED